MIDYELIPIAEPTDMDRFMETDPALQRLVQKCLETAGVNWTDEDIVRSAFHLLYDTADHEAEIEHLIVTWRCKRALKQDDAYQIALARAAECWEHLQNLQRRIAKGKATK